MLLAHSVPRAVNLPTSDGIDVNWLFCKVLSPIKVKISNLHLAIAFASSQLDQRCQTADVRRNRRQPVVVQAPINTEMSACKYMSACTTCRACFLTAGPARSTCQCRTESISTGSRPSPYQKSTVSVAKNSRAYAQISQRRHLANVGRNRRQLVLSQSPINQANVSVCTLACTIAEHLLPHSKVSAVKLPMSDGIDVNWLPLKNLSTEQCQRCNLHFCSLTTPLGWSAGQSRVASTSTGCSATAYQ
jgi:hypothetical protein